MSLKGIMALIIAGLLGALKLFSLQKDKLKLEKQQESQRADIAETTADSSRQRDQALSELDQQHQQETKDEKASLAKGDRDQLDTDW